MGNWWVDDQGVNNLKGVSGDTGNPIILPDYLIVDFLLANPRARADFKVIVPTMLPEEQDRLNALAASNPQVLKEVIIRDPQIESDIFQASQNRVGFFDPNRKKR